MIVMYRLARGGRGKRKIRYTPIAKEEIKADKQTRAVIWPALYTMKAGTSFRVGAHLYDSARFCAIYCRKTTGRRFSIRREGLGYRLWCVYDGNVHYVIEKSKKVNRR